MAENAGGFRAPPRRVALYAGLRRLTSLPCQYQFLPVILSEDAQMYRVSESKDPYLSLRLLARTGAWQACETLLKTPSLMIVMATAVPLCRGTEWSHLLFCSPQHKVS